MKTTLIALLIPLALAGQVTPPVDSWPTYNGDYSGRRFSPLKQINQLNVKAMTLAWIYHATAGQNAPATIVGGLGPGTPPVAGRESNFGGLQIKATPLMLNSILYFATPDNAWAVDARSGRELWHYFWKTTGGIHIGNRGVGISGNWLFFETPDNYLVSLDARTGKERWHVQIADVREEEYFSTPAPIVVGNHVMVGTGGDSLDVPGFLEAVDPETGALQWKWWSEPLKKGDPGSETWPDENSMRHGGGMTWIPGTYDPELKLYYIGTGNPQPVETGHGREGDNLWTCSIVALNIETGKIAWYYQVSPHDTHDWDAAETPVLIDGLFNDRPRKLLAQASRNGYFFLLDRTNGKHLTAKMIESMNWSKGINAKGQPIPDPAKESAIDGVLVSPNSTGATNWPPPSFDPETGLFYVGTKETFSEFYLTDTDAHPEGYAAVERNAGSWGDTLRAMDYRTGKTVWSHRYPAAGATAGILTTAGKLLFTGDGSQNLIAFDPLTGKILWHAGLGANVSNGPETYLLDGQQYLVVGAGDSLFAFTVAQ